MSNSNDSKQQSPPLKLWCLNLSHLDQTWQFTFLTGFLLAFFMANSYMEEYIFRMLPGFNYGWFMTFFELACFGVFSVVEQIFTKPSGEAGGIFARKAPIWGHMKVAIAMTAARGLTNESLAYLSYPTQVVFKSMKLITVMIGSVIMLSKSYSIFDYTSAGLLVSSAIMFSMGDVKSDSNATSMYGIIIVVLSLVADSLHNNSQEWLLKVAGASSSEVVLWTNSLAAVLTLVYCVCVGELLPAFEYCRLHSHALVLLMMRSFLVYGGVVVFVTFIQRFGVVAATTITTIRKILSILASFLFFPKPFTLDHTFGTLLFSASVALNIYTVKQAQDEKAKSQKSQKQIEMSSNQNKEDQQKLLGNTDEEVDLSDAQLNSNNNNNHSLEVKIAKN